MKILNLVQGTDEWLVARIEHLTASEAPVMMGDSKFMGRNDLLALKKGWQANPNGKFKEQLFSTGHEYEELARPIAECELFDDLPPIVGSLEVEGLLLLASFDGLTEDHVTAWEHKMWNDTLAENVRNSVLEPHYYWQLEHQLLVSKADVCIFNVSDGTENNNVSMSYESVPERREKLIAGWKQFVIDLEAYELKAKTEVLVAQKIKELPLLEISLVGEVSNSNLATYKSTALTFISSIKTELQTEQDFKDASEAIKFLKNGEDELENVKTRALAQTMDIKEMFETVNELKEEMRQKRLTLSKLAKTEKDRIRFDINQKATLAFQEFISLVSKGILPIQLLSIATFDADFNIAMKGKSNIDSLQESVDTKLAQLKIEVNEVVELIKTNLDSLKELASEHKFLFNDTPHLVLKDNEDLINLIKSRISDHEQEKAAKAEQQRKNIQAEEERKAKEKIERENKAELERKAQVKRDEERKELEAEQARKQQEEHRTAKDKRDQQQEDIANGNYAQEKPIKQRLAERFEEPANSVDKEVSPVINENVRLANELSPANFQQGIQTFGEYEPLDFWPSDSDRASAELLNLVCQKLEEAETYIQMLLADKAA